ncbi:glucose-6-phosphate dehydrogenase assembly protein OpcA [Glutamicibacter soli]|uniref:OpcA protein n=1 Tax=Glutamicibacter soli TaxID=453836 RepID=A0A6L9G0S3_9MICC|nr:MULTISPECIES: glucose-6-phosphate dehydrogenase assembly protein OpcA [Micrococcaceae]ALD64193.1 OpcA protein [Arthrobacter sp. LS16]ALQ30548.1 OpcA protein [Arthrobacter sp. YC-RL1]KLI88159.1 OpcA protein [Arthrobacter sp. YC-RL1]NAZ14779.1 OpcA protein [Glutamicibacter soli]
MMIELPNTTTSKVAKKLISSRRTHGVVALSRVLTLVVITREGFAENAIEAANLASREHPCRIIVVVRGSAQGENRLDVQIRVGGDAGASEVIVMRTHGPDMEADEALISALLLPDAPIVAWWPHGVPVDPAATALGKIAHRRITDSGETKDPTAALFSRVATYRAGDTDLAWTRLTLWRAQLASIIDLVGTEGLTSITVKGSENSPSTTLLAAWLTMCLDVPVTIAADKSTAGLSSVRLSREGGDVELSRPSGPVAHLYLPGSAPQRISLPRRSVAECLAEEMRRLDADDVFGEVITRGLALTNLRSIRSSDR